MFTPVEVGEDGSIQLPPEFLAALGVTGGGVLMAALDAEAVTLCGPDSPSLWAALAAPSFAEVWDNPDDEIWNDV